MNIKKYKLSKNILTILVVSGVIYSIYANNAFFAIFAVAGGIIIDSFFKIFVKGVLADERQIAVSRKASEMSFKILMPILAFSGLALYVSGGDQEFYYIKALGIILSYITILGLAIYLGTYWYVNRQTGGK